jgi:DNA-binding FadR family transcriptional regulator
LLNLVERLHNQLPFLCYTFEADSKKGRTMAREKRLYRRILEQMLLLIDSGEFPVGGRLPPERELAERFGVSRPTIREAIIALEVLDRVEVKTGSGVYVLAYDAESALGYDPSISAFELTEARALIEGEAAALAATMISDEQLRELEESVHEMADESADGKVTSEHSDKQFHAIIARATGNKMLIKVAEDLWAIRDNSPAVHRSYLAICEMDGEKRVDEHMEILEAIKSRDPSAARMAMHAHFARIINKLIVADEQRQFDEIRRKTLESRERFSLNHLVAT